MGVGGSTCDMPDDEYKLLMKGMRDFDPERDGIRLHCYSASTSYILERIKELIGEDIHKYSSIINDVRSLCINHLWYSEEEGLKLFNEINLLMAGWILNKPEDDLEVIEYAKLLKDL